MSSSDIRTMQTKPALCSKILELKRFVSNANENRVAVAFDIRDAHVILKCDAVVIFVEVSDVQGNRENQIKSLDPRHLRRILNNNSQHFRENAQRH